MDYIGTGHYIFAAIFAVSFIVLMILAYKKDFSREGYQYKQVWLIIVGVVVIYFIIFFLNRFT